MRRTVLLKTGLASPPRPIAALPKHLPRVEEVIEPESLVCACGCLHHIGEDVAERLDVIPAQFCVRYSSPQVCVQFLVSFRPRLRHA